MDELNQFLSSVEVSARKIIKQQSKKAQESAIRERADLTRQSKQPASLAVSSSSGSGASSITRDELRAKYTPGGALIVNAGSSLVGDERQPLSPANGRRSEHDASLNLPKLPPSPAKSSLQPQHQQSPSPLTLPALDKAPKKLAKPLASSSSARRNPNAAKKLLESPLYKALAASQAAADAPNAFGGNNGTRAVRKALQQVDQVSVLLRKMGLRDAGMRSPAARPDHAVEKRMCNACWARPDKRTGCEHHPHMLPSSSNSSLELQGPMSWQSDDLFVKYRSEADREALWAAFLRLQEQRQQQQLDDDGEAAVVVVPEVARHPVWAKFATQLEVENLRTLAETRRRNLAKTFIFDVNHLWLTNLDHFNASYSYSYSNNGESEAEKNALRGRRDDDAVRNGYSQIPSISTARALTHAWQSSFSNAPKPPTSADPTTDVPVSRRRKRRHRSDRDAFYPLSLLVCGYQPPASDTKAAEQIAAWLDQVPGVALVGQRLVLWWSYMPGHQAELARAKDGDASAAIEFATAVAMFARDAVRSSSNAILVSLVVAIDAPVLAPPLFAWHVGSKQPPPCPTTFVASPSFAPAIPQQVATLVNPQASQLLAKPVDMRLDTLLPCTLMVLNCMATPEDHDRLSSEPCGHRRDWDELDSDAFRQWLLLDASRCLLPEQFVPVRDVDVSAATLNAPHVGGRYCWHETRAVDYELIRMRTARDYLHVVLNTLARGGSNDATLFAVAMAHERILDVRNCGKLGQYMAMLAERRRQEESERELREIERKLAAGRLLLEAKRQEQQRIEEALQVAAARAQDRLDGHHTVNGKASGGETSGTGEDGREWTDRVAQSVVVAERGGWEQRELPQDDGVMFYRSVNDQLPARHRFRWQPPIGWDDADTRATSAPIDSIETEREEDTSADGDSDEDNSDEEDAKALEEEHAKNAKDMTAMARELLSDAQFLSLLKDKLGLRSDPSDVTPSTISSALDGSSANSDASRHRPDVLTRLGLGSTGVFDENEVSDASKAGLVASRMAKLAVPVHAESSKPAVLARGRPGEGWKRLARSKLPQDFACRVYQSRVEGPRSAFINQPNHATPVGMLDPTEWSEHDPPEFIPELRALFVPRAASDLQEKKTQWAAYERRAKVEQPMARAANVVDELEGEQEPQETSMEQKVARAVLCARNNNLEGLEAALDEGVDVNARDNHGNSLFILVCQQGNKRLAKLLMRRHANMNLTNLNGNTALHYLVEYKHAALAEYVKAKGADDTVQNAAGLTCYEGLSQDQLDAL